MTDAGARSAYRYANCSPVWVVDPTGRVACAQNRPGQATKQDPCAKVPPPTPIRACDVLEVSICIAECYKSREEYGGGCFVWHEFVQPGSDIRSSVVSASAGARRAALAQRCAAAVDITTPRARAS